MKIRRDNETREEFYGKSRDFYLAEYWREKDDNLFRPNGFTVLPEEFYQAFSAQIDKNGKVLDLGCGNGLMLKYLMATSGYKLIPYGVDFLERSIKQAKEILFPEYADNFETCNVVDYTFEKGPFDFIFTFVSHIYPKQRKEYIEKVMKSCKKGGRVIFYEYDKVIKSYGLTWVGEFTELKNIDVKRKEHPKVSLAVFNKK